MVNVKSHARKSKTGKVHRVSSHYRKRPDSRKLLSKPWAFEKENKDRRTPKNIDIRKELEDLSRQKADMTHSDIQGSIDVLVSKMGFRPRSEFGRDAKDLLMEYADGDVDIDNADYILNRLLLEEESGRK